MYSHFILVILLLRTDCGHLLPHNLSDNVRINETLNDKSSDGISAASLISNKLMSKSQPANELIVKNCENVHIRDKFGSIKSPDYPYQYKNHTSCTWHIHGDPNDVITISFEDIDLGEDLSELCVGYNSSSTKSLSGLYSTCCALNWVKIGSSNGKHEKRFCGRSENHKLLDSTYMSVSDQVWIKFHSGIKVKVGRGFHLTYMVGPKKSDTCSLDEFRCENGKCIVKKWRCNRRNECGDGSDELLCDDVCAGSNEIKCGTGLKTDVPGCYSFPFQRCDGTWDCDDGSDEKGCGGCPADMFVCQNGMICYTDSKRCDGTMDCADFSDELNCGFCGSNKTLCSPTSITQCFDPFNEKCNRVLDCDNGVDEKGCITGCLDKILCSSGSGCYLPEERCNGLPDCSDYSDERNCTLEMCRSNRGSYLCSNGKCIRSAWTCDHSNDCGDSTDEINCLKNSVITAAIMGSLICGLLLIIAISCTCKLIALRHVEQQQTHENSGDSNSSQEYRRPYPWGSHFLDSDAPLFRFESDFFYREPPPSYAAATGTVDRSNPYVVDCRQARRQRRLRRHRRRPPSPPLAILPVPEDGIGTVRNYNDDCQLANTSTSAGNNNVNTVSVEDKSESAKETNTNISDLLEESPEVRDAVNVNIELDDIPSPSQSNCDLQPLLS